MSGNRSSFTRSRPFHFVVGEESTCFYAHTDLIAQQSPTLAALVTGGMKEANGGCARLDDVDSDTFSRFLEFVYTGDYTVPDPEIVLSANDIGHELEQNK